MRNRLVIVRTHLMNDAVRTMLARLRREVGYDILVLCDERRGRIDVPAGFAKASVTPKLYRRYGLHTTPDVMWRCGDYAVIVGADLHRSAEFVWLIEPDVWLNFQDWGAFFAIFEARPDIDFVARGNVAASASWRWSRSMTPFVETACFCLFSIARFSRRAIDRVREERKRVAGAFTPAAFPDLRDKPGFDLDDLWPNDEVFTASVLHGNGFGTADFNDFGRLLATDESFGLRPHSIAALRGGPADDRIYHPAHAGADFAARLHHVCRVRLGEGRSLAQTIDWLGDATLDALDLECGAGAKDSFLQRLIAEAAAGPVAAPDRTVRRAFLRRLARLRTAFFRR